MKNVEEGGGGGGLFGFYFTTKHRQRTERDFIPKPYMDGVKVHVDAQHYSTCLHNFD